jgi:hypothetical protein
MNLPRLLAACTRPSVHALSRIFHRHALLIPTFNTIQAIGRLAIDIDVMLCTDDFELGRALDLMRKAKAASPNTPIVGCRVLGDALSSSDVQVAKIMTTTVGAADFIALPNLQRDYGSEEADRQFRQLVLRYVVKAAR